MIAVGLEAWVRAAHTWSVSYRSRDHATQEQVLSQRPDSYWWLNKQLGIKLSNNRQVVSPTWQQMPLMI